MKSEYFIKPITFHEARSFVQRHHSYLPQPRGCLFCVGVANALGYVATAIISRPISPNQQDGITVEVNRLATIEGHQNVASMCLGAAWKAAKALGYNRMISYVDARLNGECFIAAGWHFVITKPRAGWHSRPLIIPANATANISLFERKEVGNPTF